MTLHYTDDAVTLHHGDALDVLRSLPDASVDCCVTSPPYFGLRDYGVPGQYGLEASPAEYVETMRALFAEVRRVLADDGTLWLNLGDSYASGSRSSYANTGKAAGRVGASRPTFDLPEKNLLGIPWRVAFALQDDGWILRNDIIWNKPNAMPESVTDRLSCRHEYLFMFSKSRRYWFDLDPVREPLTRPEALAEGIIFGGNSADVGRRRGSTYGKASSANLGPTGRRHNNVSRRDSFALGRNPGDVWTIPTQPFSEAHFAVMPQALAERAILSGCKPGGVALDPFSGSGTTGAMANKHGRRYLGIDLNRDYLDLSLRTRLGQMALLDGEGA